MSKKNGLMGLVRGKHVKIRHLEKEGWSMTVGGREIPHVRAVTARFEAGNVTTVAVEFFPSGVSIDTDLAEVGLIPIDVESGDDVTPLGARFRQWAGYRWRNGW